MYQPISSSPLLHETNTCSAAFHRQLSLWRWLEGDLYNTHSVVYLWLHAAEFCSLFVPLDSVSSLRSISSRPKGCIYLSVRFTIQLMGLLRFIGSKNIDCYLEAWRWNELKMYLTKNLSMKEIATLHISAMENISSQVSQPTPSCFRWSFRIIYSRPIG